MDDEQGWKKCLALCRPELISTCTWHMGDTKDQDDSLEYCERELLNCRPWHSPLAPWWALEELESWHLSGNLYADNPGELGGRRWDEAEPSLVVFCNSTLTSFFLSLSPEQPLPLAASPSTCPKSGLLLGPSSNQSALLRAITSTVYLGTCEFHLRRLRHCHRHWLHLPDTPMR